MNKSRFNLIIDSIAFLLLLTLVSTGFLISFRLPPRSGHGLSIWGMDRHQWGEVHLVLALVFLAILLVHLFMHWSWIKALFLGKKQWRFGLKQVVALVLFAVISFLIFSPLFSSLAPVESRSGQRQRVSFKTPKLLLPNGLGTSWL